MKRSILLPSAAAFLAASPAVYAAGFQLQERSAAGLGRAFSGEAAMGDDASVIASNPAGMMLLEEEWALATGASAVIPQVDIKGSFFPPAPAPPGTKLDADADDVAESAYVPYAYVAKRFSNQISFGLGFGAYTTYGLHTNYPTDFVGRTLADRSQLTSVNFNPAIAWRINRQWSVGAGFDALYADGKLTSTLPNGSSLLRLSGDDWGYGYNLGVLFEADECTRLGLHYRSSVNLKLEGESRSVLIPPFNGSAHLGVDLPDTVEFSAVHDIGPWSIHGDILWTHWEKFRKLEPIVHNSPAQPPITEENWDDSWRFSAGTTWRANDNWTLRAGVAYDLTPVDEENLTLRIPDSDRLWLTMGFSWQFMPCWKMDVGYAHLFAESVEISEGSAATGFFDGKATSGADVISIGISAEF